MSQVVEAKWPHARPLERLLEPNATLARVVRPPRLGMAEDELVVVGVSGALEVTFQLAGDAIGHRYGTAGPAALRGRVLAARVAAPDADQAGGPVDVSPPERRELALAHARHGGREPEQPGRPSARGGAGAGLAADRAPRRRIARGRPIAAAWRCASADRADAFHPNGVTRNGSVAHTVDRSTHQSARTRHAEGGTRNG
jgi:hypothetical protein